MSLNERSVEDVTGQSLEATLLLTNVDPTLTDNDLQDSLVDQSLSETILLQNVNFDPNLFEGLNLDLENNGNNSGSTSISNNINDIGLELTPDHSLEQLNLLDNIELQILKVAQSSSQTIGHTLLNSSDPLVSSTTTVYSFNKVQAEKNDSDLINFKYFNKLPNISLEKEGLQANIKLNEATDEPEKDIAKDQENRSIDNRSSSLKSYANEKVLLATGPISSSLNSLSMTNIKMISQNVMSNINKQENDIKQQSQAISGQIQQTRLIIIENNNQTYTQPLAKESKAVVKLNECSKNIGKSGAMSTNVRENKGKFQHANAPHHISGRQYAASAWPIKCFGLRNVVASSDVIH